jgi:hypothetical protein
MEIMIQNSYCDGGRCVAPDGEVRVLPLGAIPDHGNMILCQACFMFEMQYRKERNRTLGKDCQFKIPAWEDLKVYEGAK